MPTLTIPPELLAKDVAVVGEAKVGGPFSLTSHEGKRVTDADLHGEFALLYFGFTYCPDICPDELEKIAAAVDVVGAWWRWLVVRVAVVAAHVYVDMRAQCNLWHGLDEITSHTERTTGARVQPVFISVDPERDNVKQVRAQDATPLDEGVRVHARLPTQVKKYVEEFHPRMLGLTGAPDKVCWVERWSTYAVCALTECGCSTGQGCCEGIPCVLQQDGRLGDRLPGGPLDYYILDRPARCICDVLREELGDGRPGRLDCAACQELGGAAPRVCNHAGAWSQKVAGCAATRFLALGT